MGSSSSVQATRGGPSSSRNHPNGNTRNSRPTTPANLKLYGDLLREDISQQQLRNASAEDVKVLLQQLRTCVAKRDLYGDASALTSCVNALHRLVLACAPSMQHNSRPNERALATLAEQGDLLELLLSSVALGVVGDTPMEVAALLCDPELLGARQVACWSPTVIHHALRTLEKVPAPPRLKLQFIHEICGNPYINLDPPGAQLLMVVCIGLLSVSIGAAEEASAWRVMGGVVSRFPHDLPTVAQEGIANVAVMALHPVNVSLDALRFLASAFHSYPMVASVFTLRGGIPVLMGLVASMDEDAAPELVQLSHLCLSEVSADENAIVGMMDADTLQLIVRNFQTFKEDIAVSQLLATCMANIARVCRGDQDRQLFLTQMGLHELLIEHMDFLGHDANITFMVQCFRCLGYLSLGNPQTKEVIGGQKVVDALVTVIRKHSTENDLLRAGIPLFAELCPLHVDFTLAIKVANIVMRGMLTLEEDGITQRWGCMALGSLLDHSEEVCEHILQNGGPQRVMRSVQLFTSDALLLADAIVTLQRLSEADLTVAAAIVDQQATLKVFITILRTFPVYGPLIRSTLCLLSDCLPHAKDTAYVASYLRGRGIEALLNDAIETFPTSEIIREAATSVITKLAEAGQLRPRTANSPTFGQNSLGSSTHPSGGAPVDEAMQCVICMEKRANILFKPCRHAVCCVKCSPYVATCPICKEPIESRTQGNYAERFNPA